MTYTQAPICRWCGDCDACSAMQLAAIAASMQLLGTSVWPYVEMIEEGAVK